MALLPARILLEDLIDALLKASRILLRFRADRIGRNALKNKLLLTGVRHIDHKRARPNSLRRGSRECAAPAAAPAPTTTAWAGPTPSSPAPAWSHSIGKSGELRCRIDLHNVIDQEVPACFDAC